MNQIEKIIKKIEEVEEVEGVKFNCGDDRIIISIREEFFENDKEFQKSIKKIIGVNPTPCDVEISDWFVYLSEINTIEEEEIKIKIKINNINNENEDYIIFEDVPFNCINGDCFDLEDKDIFYYGCHIHNEKYINEFDQEFLYNKLDFLIYCRDVLFPKIEEEHDINVFDINSDASIEVKEDILIYLKKIEIDELLKLDVDYSQITADDLEIKIIKKEMYHDITSLIDNISECGGEIEVAKKLQYSIKSMQVDLIYKNYKL